jgi:hypothetical protein
MGNELFPHPQWARLASLWDSFYPLTSVNPQKQRLFRTLQAEIPEFVKLLVSHRPKSLLGKSLKEVMSPDERQPARLSALFQAWGRNPDEMRRAPPTLAVAVIGQARWDGRITPEHEAKTLSGLLNYWAVKTALSQPAGAKPVGLEPSTHAQTQNYQGAGVRFGR